MLFEISSLKWCHLLPVPTRGSRGPGLLSTRNKVSSRFESCCYGFPSNEVATHFHVSVPILKRWADRCRNGEFMCR